MTAEVGRETWKQLTVFDDGWVETSTFARSLSDTRSDLRKTLVTLALIFGSVGVGKGLTALGAPPAAETACLVVGGAAIVYAMCLVVAMRWRGLMQSGADLDQLGADRRAGRVPTARPGAPRWKLAGSAAEMASWFTGVGHVAATDVTAVEVVDLPRRGWWRRRTHRVDVRLVDGRTRTYASPDRRLVDLLTAFARP